MPSEPLSLTLREAARLIAARELAAEALVEACLDRIARREEIVGAWQYLDPERARDAARRADSEGVRGPLHGIPVGVKDLIDSYDMPTGYGSPIYAGHRPAADAACVALARAGGAVMLGKTVTTEFATFTPGKTANPRNAAHTPGGSSSGSAAAVADGMVPVAFGTQTAGSVIRPAAYCGIVGYKPSFGTISRAGVKPLCDSLDTVGVLARRVEDAAFFAGVLAARPALREAAMPDGIPRLGFCPTAMWDEADPETEAAIEDARAALAAAGAELPDIPVPAEHRALTQAQESVMGFEIVRGLADERLRHSAELSPNLARQLDLGMTIGADVYDAALARTAAARDALESFFAGYDAILVPAAPGEAPAGLGSTGNPVFNRMWTLLGLPCITMPARWGSTGLPTGIQMIGRIGDDARLMSYAIFVERALGQTR